MNPDDKKTGLRMIVLAKEAAMSVPQSIADFLTREGVPYSTLTHPVAYTAQEETAAAHVPGREWAKTVVCFAGDEPLLAVLPALYAVDLKQLRQVAAVKTLRLAREDELEALYPDSEPGAMPPLGTGKWETRFCVSRGGRSMTSTCTADPRFPPFGLPPVTTCVP